MSHHNPVWTSTLGLTLPDGELAQLVERCDRTAEVRGSNPLFSIGAAGKITLLIALAVVVFLTSLARPSSVLTFMVLAAAGAISSRSTRRSRHFMR